jgi:hypothetical protein
MGWLTDKWITLHQALGVRRFAISGIEGLGAAGVDYLARHWDDYPFRNVPKLAIWILILAGLLLWWLLDYATKLRKDREPKIELVGLAVRNELNNQYVRVLVANKSAATIDGLKAKLADISDEAGVLKRGHVLDAAGQWRRLNFPIQLFTSERLKERLASGDQFARPFTLSPGEPKLLEIFHLTHINGVFACIFDGDKWDRLITPDLMSFACEIYGGGAPTNFTLRYEAIQGAPRNGFSLTLLGPDGTVADTKTFWEPEPLAD